MTKAISMFNVMHDQDLTLDEGYSFCDLVKRMAVNPAMPERPKSGGTAVLTANPDETVVQAIRRLYRQRPFILRYNGEEISITKDLTEPQAMLKGMNAMMDANKSAVKQTKPKTIRTKKSQPVVEAQPQPPAPEPEQQVLQPEPQPEPAKQILTLKRKIKPVVQPDPEPEEDELEDLPDDIKTIEQNPHEPLTKAVARAWPQRPVKLVAGNSIILITEDMSVVDAQLKASEAAGVDYSEDGEEDEGQAHISSSGIYFHASEAPYQVAVFEHPIPVDDSRYNISLDRNSGAEYIRTERAVWMDGYPYRISCVPFDDYMNTETMFYVHCKERPSQDMFDIYHALFRKRTHKVHVRVSNDSHDGSAIITQQYCGWRPNPEKTPNQVSSVMEALGLNARWEPGSHYRIRYWDTNFNCYNHRYYLKRPDDASVRLLNHTKAKAMVQTRPAGV